jgi:hypothetical protein
LQLYFWKRSSCHMFWICSLTVSSSPLNSTFLGLFYLVSLCVDITRFLIDLSRIESPRCCNWDALSSFFQISFCFSVFIGLSERIILLFGTRSYFLPILYLVPFFDCNCYLFETLFSFESI